MAQNIIQTEWPQWDKYLSKYANKKLTCLVVGANNGKYTEWLLNNLCMNNYSRVFSIDKWDPTIEKEFDTTISNSPNKDQNIKMNMKIAKALLKLKEVKYLSFDIIIIGDTLDARKILINTILSWDIIVEGGILLFTNYNSNDDNNIKIKIAIDSFVGIYKPQLKMIYIGNEYMIEKINNREMSKKELEEYYQLLDDINYFKDINIQVNLHDEIIDDIKYKLELSSVEYEEEKIIRDVLPNISNRSLLPAIFNVDLKTENVFSMIELLNDSDLLNNINMILQYFKIKNTDMFRYISRNHIIYYLNNITSNKKILFVDTKMQKNTFDKLYKLTKCKYKIDEIYLTTKLTNNNTYNEFINNIENRFDMIEFRYIRSYSNHKEDHSFIYLLFYIGLIFNCLNPNGYSYIYIPIWYNKNLIVDIVYILKKYFKEIKLITKLYSNTNRFYVLVCNIYYNTIKDVSEYNKLIEYIYNNNIKYINRFLLINNNNLYNKYKNKIINFIDKLVINNLAITDLHKKIYLYIKKNNDKKLYNNILYTLIKLKLNYLYYYIIKYEYNLL